jgi:hypothetical protein
MTMLRNAHDWRIVMAKLSDLVVRTSEVTGLPEATVREISRRLREANLIRTGTGGRYGGADMTARDAARLLTAILTVRASSIPLTNVARVTQVYLSDLKAHRPRGHQMILGRWDRRLGLPELCNLKRGHTFQDAFEAVVVSFSNRDFECRLPEFHSVELIVKITGPRPEREAKIEFETGAFGRLDLFYMQPRIAKERQAVSAKRWSDIPEDVEFDMSVNAQLGESTIKAIGLLLRDSEDAHD